MDRFDEQARAMIGDPHMYSSVEKRIAFLAAALREAENRAAWAGFEEGQDSINAVCTLEERRKLDADFTARFGPRPEAKK